MFRKAVLAGDLNFISLADSFQILGGNNSTGILRITSQYVPTPGLIYFVDGNPVNAANGSLQGMDAIYSLFGWTEGGFEFHEEEVQVEHVITSSRMEIVLDALRMFDDGVIKKVGPLSCDDIADVVGSGFKYGKGEAMPVIKGPLVDYMYVIDEEEFRDGEMIVAEGGHGNWVWVILEGKAKITRETSNGPMTIARLGEGCFIGSLASFLQREYVRNATVTAMGDIQLGVLDTQRLYQEYASLSFDFRSLLSSLDGRLTKITDTAADLFVKRDTTDRLIKDEKPIIEEGTQKGDMFTIKGGEAYVARQTPNGYLPLLTLKEGDVFGYVPFMDVGHEPRRASVVASKDLEVGTLDAESLQREYVQLSGTFRSLVVNVCTSVALTTRMVCYCQEN